MTMLTPAQIDDVKGSVDLFDLASQYTTLSRTGNERYGPCPDKTCSGRRDSFHVHASGWWFCRKCHPVRSDVIGFVQHYERATFIEACNRIAGRRLTVPAQPATPQPAKRPAPRWNTRYWQRKTQRRLEQACVQLESPDGTAARDYLLQRGFTPDTWRRWCLGYSPDSPPYSKEDERYLGGPSITIPYWRHQPDDQGNKLWALRYRRLDPSEERYVSHGGSANILHGLHHIDLTASTLIVVEGEFNAISIWQDARDLGLAVVSIGSQHPGENTFTALAWLSRYYERCVIWCDEPANALDVRAKVTSSTVLAFQSPKVNGKKLDANDMLRCGVLRNVLQRIQAMRGETQ